MFKIGDKLIFKRHDGTEEDCEMIFKGYVPGCVVVQFFKDGRPTNHDGLTLPIKQLRKASQ